MRVSIVSNAEFLLLKHCGCIVGLLSVSVTSFVNAFIQNHWHCKVHRLATSTYSFKLFVVIYLFV